MTNQPVKTQPYKRAGLLTIVLGLILAVGVGALSRPLVRARPARDPASVEKVASTLRPYELAGASGLALIGIGSLLILRKRPAFAPSRAS
jgi:hypothetical protein